MGFKKRSRITQGEDKGIMEKRGHRSPGIHRGPIGDGQMNAEDGKKCFAGVFIIQERERETSEKKSY